MTKLNEQKNIELILDEYKKVIDWFIDVYPNEEISLSVQRQGLKIADIKTEWRYLISTSFTSHGDKKLQSVAINKLLLEDPVFFEKLRSGIFEGVKKAIEASQEPEKPKSILKPVEKSKFILATTLPENISKPL